MIIYKNNKLILFQMKVINLNAIIKLKISTNNNLKKLIRKLKISQLIWLKEKL